MGFAGELEVRFPARLLSFTQQGASFLLRTEDAQGEPLYISVSFYENGSVGFFMGEREAFAVDCVVPEARHQAKQVAVHETEDAVELVHTTCRLRITRAPYALTVYGLDGRELWQELYEEYNSVGAGFEVIPPTGLALSPEGEQSVRLCASLRYDEHFYGLGERFGEFDKRGQRVLMRNDDTLGCRDEKSYKNVPFFLSSRGYGLFVNSAAMTEFDFGCVSNACVTVRVPSASAEWFLIPGSALESILSVYVSMTGKAALPPDWSFGLWYSNGFQDASRDAVMNSVAGFRERNIPLSVVHYDCYWMRDDSWCDFVWDEQRFPNFEEMLRALHEQNLRVCVWINPYVTNKTEMFEEGSAKGYFVKNAAGETYQSDLWHGLLSLCVMVDFTNPDAKKWYQEKVKTLLRQGVDICKTDFGEDIPLDACFANGQTGTEMRNMYATLFNQAVFEATAEVYGQEQAMVWARSGFAGMQRYPVCWSGDPRSSWQGMAATLRGGLSAALSGILFWSHDIGGFYGPVEPDVYIRWLQFGLFSSHVRMHGTTERAPWAYGAEAERIATELICMRQNLLPYILQTAQSCVDTGLPFIAPLVLRNPDDPTVFSIWDEYYFGTDMIAVPVFGGDGAIRRFYLPEGEWADVFTGQSFTGRAWHTVTVPLERFPLLRKQP